MRFRRALASLALAGMLWPAPSEATDTPLRLPSGFTLTLPLPAGWRSAATSKGRITTALIYSAPKNTEPTILLIVFDLPPGSPIKGPSDLQGMLQKDSLRHLADAGQERIDVLDFRPSQGIG